MENTEILGKMMELCDSITETHDATIAKRSEHVDAVSRDFIAWHNQFTERYAKVTAKIEKMAAICSRLRSRDDGRMSPFEWSVTIKKAPFEFIVTRHERADGGYMKVYRFKHGFSAGSCSSFYPLKHANNVGFNLDLAGIFSDFLANVDFSYFDKAFMLKLTELAKEISDHDARTLASIS